MGNASVYGFVAAVALVCLVVVMAVFLAYVHALVSDTVNDACVPGPVCGLAESALDMAREVFTLVILILFLVSLVSVALVAYELF